MEEILKKLESEREFITAVIELRVTPAPGAGFDKLASRICKYPQVLSLRLMSGGYDFSLTVEGKSIKDIANFVSEKLSTMDGVVGTATHFELKKYKDNGVVLSADDTDNREMITF
ncbi:MAG: Lrp/AsnC ligand binding domain-containing protein [Oscillospiraceae bacterium]|nr:Lrp/AsnC ligand binding domain-containing protein [Oscillospiraceae bacterium]